MDGNKSTKPKRVIRYMDPAEYLRRLLDEKERTRANWRRPGPKPGTPRKKPLHGPPKPVKFYLPETLDVERYAPELRWPIAYLSDRIHRGRVWRWKWLRQDGYTPLKHDYLTKIIPGPLLRRVRRRLIEDGVIECDFTAMIGSKCFGYRLKAAYQQVRSVACTDDAFARRVRRLYDTLEQDLQAEHRHLLDWLRRVDIDLKRAAAIVRRLPLPRKKRKQKYTVEQYRRELWTLCEIIADREHAVVVDKYGRCHTLATRLKNDLLPCLSVGGNGLVSLDLSGSQPLFAGLLALRWYGGNHSTKARISRTRFKEGNDPYHAADKALETRENAKDAETGRGRTPPPCSHRNHENANSNNGDTPGTRYQPPLLGNYPRKSKGGKGLAKGAPGKVPADVLEYLEVCERGQFYQRLMTKGEKRRTVTDPAFYRRFKARVLTVLYKSNKWGRFPNEMAARLKRKYPSVMAMLKALKRHDYRHAARLMQNLESTMFIRRVCGRLMRERPDVPVLTKHDSILTTPEHAETVVQIIKEAFIKLGIKPHLKREVYR
jgi:hypothetical protein